MNLLNKLQQIFFCIECTMIYWIFTRSYSMQKYYAYAMYAMRCVAMRCTELHWNCPTHSSENKSNEVKRFNQTRNPKAPKTPKPKPVELIPSGCGCGGCAKGWLTWAQQQNHLTKYLRVDWKLSTLAPPLPLSPSLLPTLSFPPALSVVLVISMEYTIYMPALRPHS